jgi:hypothetical protein
VRRPQLLDRRRERLAQLLLLLDEALLIDAEPLLHVVHDLEGEGREVELEGGSILELLHEADLAPVALLAPQHRVRTARHELAEHVVLRVQDQPRGVVVARRELHVLRRVAARAVRRRDDRGHVGPLVEPGHDLVLLGAVAVVAADTLLGVLRAGPLLDHAGRLLAVALDARRAVVGDEGAELGDAHLGRRLVPPPLLVRHHEQGHGEQEPQDEDHDSLGVQGHGSAPVNGPWLPRR